MVDWTPEVIPRRRVPVNFGEVEGKIWDVSVVLWVVERSNMRSSKK